MGRLIHIGQSSLGEYALCSLAEYALCILGEYGLCSLAEYSLYILERVPIALKGCGLGKDYLARVSHGGGSRLRVFD